MERYEPDRLYSLIDSIPEQAMGVTVLPEGFKEYHKAVMAWRYENVFVPAWEDLRGVRPCPARAPAIGTSVRPNRLEPGSPGVSAETRPGPVR